MSPPELARDSPVMNIFQPIHVNFVEAFRYNLHQAILDRAHCWRCEWCHFDEPLLRDERLNHSIAALAVTQRHHIVLGLYNQPKPIQFFHQVFASFVTVLSCIGTRLCGHFCVKTDDLHERQIMAFANLKVYWIMGRRHLYSSSAKGGIHSLVCNNWYFAANDR